MIQSEKECQRECIKHTVITLTVLLIITVEIIITKRLWSFIKQKKKDHYSIPQYMLMILFLQIVMKNSMLLAKIMHQCLPKKIFISTYN